MWIVNPCVQSCFQRITLETGLEMFLNLKFPAQGRIGSAYKLNLNINPSKLKISVGFKSEINLKFLSFFVLKLEETHQKID